MIAVVKYNAGNIQSVLFALERLGVQGVWTDDPDVLYKADKVIFPGQGEASTAMRYLRERGLDDVLRNLKQPTLGICIGQQLFCSHSEENDTDCLGVFSTRVRRFSGKDGLKVPQMGWNRLHSLHGPLFKGVAERSYVYFIHSYYVEQDGYSIALADYGETFSAGIQRDNYFALQFHPEKSGPAGQQILKNFIDM